MKLTAEQQAAVRTWAAGGATLSEIQNRLREELDVNMTYMEARLLLIDLDVTLQDPKDEEKVEKKPEEAAPADVDAEAGESDEEADFADDDGAPGPSSVRVSLDELTIPGTVASGGVTFSDGKKAKWYLDQMGRLGLQGSDPGYQPPTADVPAFQRQLQALLSRI